MPSITQALRNIFGLYDQPYEESSKNNPSVEPAFLRLSADFRSLQVPSAPTPLPSNPPPSADDLLQWDQENRAYPARLALYYATLSDMDRLLDKNRTLEITKSDSYKLESALMELCTSSYLQHIYPSIRERYRGIAGAEAYRAYIEGLRPDPKKTPLDTCGLRSDALHLLAEMRRLAIALPRREQIRKWILAELLIVDGTIAMFLLVLLLNGSPPFWGPGWHYFPFAWIVAFWSLSGGIISVARRIQTLPDEELNLAQWGRLPILFSPITSICFGLILLHLFSAGIVTGTVFPSMSAIYVSGVSQCATPKMCDYYACAFGRDLFHWMRYISGGELSKLIIWSFIAGFAENFVPDTLDSLVKRKKN